MKKTLFLSFIFLSVYASAQSDPVLSAASDELQRTVTRLKLDKYPAPYFASYYIADSSENFVSASFGELKESNSYFNRNARVEIRIGSSEFDSSNYISNFRDYKPLYRSLAVQDDYDLIRKGLWLMSDDAYKIAVERYSQKQSYRKKKDIKDVYGDLDSQPPFKHIEEPVSCGGFDKQYWEDRIKKISGEFRKYPNIFDSDVDMRFNAITRRFVDSQSISYRTYYCQAMLSVSVYTQNESGYKVKDSQNFLYASWQEAKSDDIESKVNEYAKAINDSYKAEKLDYYVGPAVFTGQAAAEFINQLFVRNISFNPKPWAEKDEWLKYYYHIPKLKERIGKRVLPGFVDVFDDPSVKEYEGKRLSGHYVVDSQGIAAPRLDLVRKGKLEAIYASRTPDEQTKKSNGHGRTGYDFFPYASAGNLFFVSEKNLSEKELKEKLMAMGKEQELDYVLVIKKVSIYKDSEKEIGDPILVYKLDLKTGVEKPVDISEFEGIGLRALRDIEASSLENQVYNFYQRGPYSYYPSPVPSSIICPQSLLIREIELKKTQEKPEKKPYLKHPYFEK